MLTTAPRKFGIFDAMVLVAAPALSLVLIREYLDDPRVLRTVWGIPNDQSIASLWRLGSIYSGLLSPLAVSLSLALFILRLRQPRPDRRRLLRQPGMVASTTILIVTSVFLVKVLLSEYYFYHARGMTPHLLSLWVMRLPWNGEVVAVAWILLWLGGLWHAEQSWIDRAGRVLGAYWIASGVFFNYVLRY